MSRVEHTPGPWSVSEQTTRVAVKSKKADRLVAHTGVSSSSVQRPRALADARLIAAAPDLLEALRQVTQYANIMATFETETHDAIIAAITKATGEPV